MMSRTSSWSWVLCGLLSLTLCLGTHPDVEDVFDRDDDEESYQREYVINVPNKAEECYYIADVRLNQVLNFHFVVSFKKIFLKVS